MKQPSEAELREWWEREQKFMDTPFGRQWFATRWEAERLMREHECYQKTVLDYVAREPFPIREHPANSIANDRERDQTKSIG